MLLDNNRILISLGSNLGEFGSNDKGYYWKLPNGLIFQWGRINLKNFNNIIRLPIPFNSTNYYVKTGIWNQNSSYGADYDFQIRYLEKEAAYVMAQEFNDGTSFIREYADFFAIGY